MFYPQAVEQLRADGYAAIEHERIRQGQRVRHIGEKYPEAFASGTATVYAVMEKVGSSWARSYGQRDIEVVVKRDRDPDDTVSLWANYHTAPIEGVAS